jgi:enoyl-CoA hydratase/carnithine racemase
MADILLRDQRQGIVELTLNRPEKANALNSDLVDALTDALLDCYVNRTQLLVLRGVGKNFCAGFDLTDLSQQTDADLVLRFIRIEAMLQSVFHAPFHTLALAHGAVYGAGADLVCACTERVAAPGASFAFPGPRFGVVLGTGRLASRIGWDRVNSILFQSSRMQTEEALSLHFIDAVCDEAAWRSLIEDRFKSLQMIPVRTIEQLRGVTMPDSRIADMAALVDSIRAPGLKERMLGYLTKLSR